MKTREKLTVLGERNPGAILVLTQVYDMLGDTDELHLVLDTLAKNKKFGSSIWCIFKDTCYSDIENFIRYIKLSNTNDHRL